MVKTPKTRHAKPRREPLTIELDPGAVERVASAEPADASEQSVFVAPASIDEAAASGSPAPEMETTETGAAAPSDRDYDPVEPSTAPSDYGFEEQPAQPRVSDPKPGPTPQPVRRSTGMSPLLAGVAGAVVALALAGVLQWAGVLGTPGSGGSNSEIAALQQDVAALKASGGTPDDVGPKLDDLSSRLEAVIGDVAALQRTVGGGGDTAGLDALSGRVKALEDRIAAGGAGGGESLDPAVLSGLNDRLSSAETSAQSAAQAVAGLDGRIAALEQSVGSLSSRVDAQASQPKVALAIAVAGLKSAVERGAPFLTELETVAAVAPQTPQIDALRPYAEKGVATRESLLAGIDTAAAAMIAAANPVDPNAGFFDRLLHSAESLVSVRPVGDVQGTDAAAIVARLEVALRAGDLDKAAAEFDTLPDAAKAAGGSFAEALKARRDVDRLLSEAVAAAVKA
jgi:hypothetical protein